MFPWEMEESVQVCAPVNMDLFKGIQLHCGVHKEPWHSPWGDQVSGNWVWCWNAQSPSMDITLFFMIFVWTGERDLQQGIKEVFKTRQGISGSKYST